MATAFLPEQEIPFATTEHDREKKRFSGGVSPSGGDKPPANEPSKKVRLLRASKTWPFLCLHSICCIALSIVLALVINGYEATDTSTPRYAAGTVRLHVSDVTTLVSVGLVIIKFLSSCWAGIAVWRCAQILTQMKMEPPLTVKQLSFMTKHNLPPWIRFPFSKPKGVQSWAVAVVLLTIFPQAFLAPLLSGAVNWNPTSVPSGRTVAVNLTDPGAVFDEWYWYNLQSVSRKGYLRKAAGYASLAWADSTTVALNGSSMTGNGCRHVVSSDSLPVNSTLSNATIPCIQIHDISWAMSADDVPRSVSNPIEDSSPLSLVDDNPEMYYYAGQAVLFDPERYWNSTQNSDVPPTATFFSGTLSVGVLLIRNSIEPYANACDKPLPSVFGDGKNITQYIMEWNRGNCYLIGTVNLTAGVTTSRVSTYISSRVVEGQTPLEDVVMEPNAWVQESLWLMPDLMTMVAVMNSTRLPTWENIDGYTEALIRTSYLAAWDMYHASFNMQGPLFTATPQESRIRATVSFERVFAWLGICLLMTLSGILLLLLVLHEDDSYLPGELINQEKDLAKASAKDIIKTLAGGVF